MADTVLVIGGGAAGYMAARTASELGSPVILVERNERIGRKVMISGKGRCNLTNYRPDIQEFIRHVPETEVSCTALCLSSVRWTPWTTLRASGFP